jgi:hypothetical protein
MANPLIAGAKILGSLVERAYTSRAAIEVLPVPNSKNYSLLAKKHTYEAITLGLVQKFKADDYLRLTALIKRGGTVGGHSNYLYRIARGKNDVAFIDKCNEYTQIGCRSSIY